VIEKNIHFNNPPGSNGEKDFKNVMKKMLPSKDGTTLPTSMVAGDYVIIQENWALDNIYDMSQLAAVAFVQNKSTKEVHQSVNSSTNPVTLPYNNDLQLMDVADFSTTNCSGTILPTVTIRNNGNNPVTTFSVKYRINNEPEALYTWSGNISSLQKAVISLPVYNFIPATSNVFKVYSADPNSVPDEYMKNDTMTFVITAAPVTTNRIIVFIKTDNAPEETTWDIRNSTGDVIASGGPYTTSGNQKDTVDLVTYDCYTFNLYDAGGNGLCCVNGSGLYYVYDDDNTVIAQGNTFKSHVFNEFNYAEAQGLPELKPAGTLSVAPNPSAGDAKAILYLNSTATVKAVLLSPLGSVVKSWDLGVLPAGEQMFGLESGNLPAGIYILRVMAGKQALNAKVSIAK
jgi:lysyl endopeptidase